MSQFPDRSRTALLVVDVQDGVVERAYERHSVVGNIARLVDRARAQGVPVIWIQHDDEQIIRGSEAWRIAPELQPSADEPVVEKSYGDAFEETGLEGLLAGLGVEKLLVVGAETDACIRSTLHGALVRGYDTFLVSDAHTTNDNTEWGAPPPKLVIDHTNLYWRYQTAPGRTASTVATDEVVFE